LCFFLQSWSQVFTYSLFAAILTNYHDGSHFCWSSRIIRAEVVVAESSLRQGKANPFMLDCTLAYKPYGDEDLSCQSLSSAVDLAMENDKLS